MGEDSVKSAETGSGVQQPWMPHPEWHGIGMHGTSTTPLFNLSWRRTPRDNGTCHLVEHHGRGMKMAEPSVEQRDLQEKDHGSQRAKPQKRECDGRGNLYTTSSGPQLTVEELGST